MTRTKLLLRSLPLVVGSLTSSGCGSSGTATTPHEEGTSGGHAHAHHGHGCHDAHHGHDATGSTDHDDFTDVECFARMFDSPERAEWQHPDEVVGILELAAGMIVADLGAGTGYFEGRLSTAVGTSGRVLALDVEPGMVEYMRARFEREQVTNVEARVVAMDDPGLAASSVDRVLVVDTWHHLSERPAYAARLAAALRPGGAVVVVDFTSESPEGPPVAMRLTAETVAAELAVAGLDAEIVDESLPHQWVVRARRAAP